MFVSIKNENKRSEFSPTFLLMAIFSYQANIHSLLHRPKNHISLFDSLRFLGCCGVFFFHTGALIAGHRTQEELEETRAVFSNSFLGRIISQGKFSLQDDL